jgi:hypothetical protein
MEILKKLSEQVASTDTIRAKVADGH